MTEDDRAGPAGRELMDGRHKRTEASRERIIRAMLDLISAGDTSPSAEAVAARAGVGQRSVFRHFDNMETLYQELNRLMAAQIRPIVEKPFQGQGWRARLAELVERRAAIFERIMPFKVAADLHRHRSPFLAAQAAELVREQRQGIKRALPAELRADPDLIEALDLVLSFDVWRRLRKEQKLTRPRARALVERLAAAAIEGARPGPGESSPGPPAQEAP